MTGVRAGVADSVVRLGTQRTGLIAIERGRARYSGEETEREHSDHNEETHETTHYAPPS